MKKVGQALTVLGIMCCLAGFAFALSLSAPVVEIVFFKSFLSDALGKSGYEVRWEEVGRAKDGSLTISISTQPAKQENAQIAHLGEYGSQLVVLVEKDRSTNNAGITTISGTQTILPWPDLDALSRVFPSSDVWQAVERIQRLQRNAFLYALASSATLLFAGEMAKRTARRNRKATKGKKRVLAIVPQQTKPAPSPRLEGPRVPAPEVPVLVRVAYNDDGDGDARKDEWPMLFSRVMQAMESARREIGEALEDDFATLLAEARPGRKVKKAEHLLRKIQEIRGALSRETPEVAVMSAPIVQQHALPLSGIEQIARALLPIDAYVPSDMDPDTARKVLLAFLRPGNKVPALGGEYISLTDLSKRLKGVPSKKVDDVLRWLSEIDVLLVRLRKKPGSKLLSLRIHAYGVVSPGKEVIDSIKHAAHQKIHMG